MKLSARNVVKGKITKLVEGPVSTEVHIRVAKGVELVSSITTGSAQSLGLKKGMKAYAVIKASSVMVATD